MERDLIQRAGTGEERPPPSLCFRGSPPACQLRGLQNSPDFLFLCLCPGVAMSAGDNLQMGTSFFSTSFPEESPKCTQQWSPDLSRVCQHANFSIWWLERTVSPFVQTIGSGVLFGSSMELTCGWSVGPGSQLGECLQVIERCPGGFSKLQLNKQPY